MGYSFIEQTEFDSFDFDDNRNSFLKKEFPKMKNINIIMENAMKNDDAFDN